MPSARLPEAPHCPAWNTDSQLTGAGRVAYPHVGVTQRVPGTSDGLLCDPGVPIGLDFQDSHLGGRARSGRGKGWVGLGELAGRRTPGYTGLVPLVRTSQRRRCPQQCHQQPLKEESRSGWVRRMWGAGWGPPGFTSILWREEVQVPRFLPLNTDGTSKIIGERYGRAGGEQTRPLHRPPSPRVPTHHWRRSGATLSRSPRGESAGVNVTGCAASSALCSQQGPAQPGLPCASPPTPPPCCPLHPASTGANLDEAVVLDEDGVTGQVPVDDGGAAGVQEAGRRREPVELGQGCQEAGCAGEITGRC